MESLPAAAITAAISAVTLALFGVDYYSMLWGFVGSLVALTQTSPMSRARAIFFVSLSTFVGAAIGNAAIDFANSTSRPMLLLGCLVGGAGSQLLINTMISALAERIKKIGGQAS